eukprot:5668753-Prymnesium_polylepis.2
MGRRVLRLLRLGRHVQGARCGAAPAGRRVDWTVWAGGPRRATARAPSTANLEPLGGALARVCGGCAASGRCAPRKGRLGRAQLLPPQLWAAEARAALPSGGQEPAAALARRADARAVV